VAYETQRGATVFDKEPHIYSEYERNILGKIPVQELLTVYQDITEADYGPLEDWQLVSPLSDYSETALDTMSVLDYLEDLTEDDGLVIWESDHEGHFTKHVLSLLIREGYYKLNKLIMCNERYVEELND